ncbi:DNA replication protein [Citrobacter telavivensis]|uniref:DNA replication protein n=1 Tax=Citrobacter telavivensis TaxID=2653932 RepID=A0A6L5EGH4_9ENTR|nr:replication protein [Citrobacter telavivensis]MPQ54627.1 DNA replication protein [Citrobacter telavivensis]QFS70946.1 DNA replication protein [Citrobacter telavivensis]
MGVVKLADYRKPQQEVMERQVADIEDGYTRIANDLLDAIMSNNFTVRQMKLLLAVIRKTYGFNKTFDWISGEQFSEMTGMPRTRCSSTKTELLNMRVLVTEGRKVGINKVISDWCVDRPERRREYGSTKHKAGYIYVFAEDEFGPVKIGFTTRDAEERLREVKYYFEGNNPKVFYVSPFHLHAGAIEPLVHEAMKEQMIRGEMFETTVAQAINKINDVMEYFTPSVTNSVTPSVNRDLQREVHTKDNNQNTEKQDPPKSPQGENSLAQEVMDYFNELTGSRCAALAPFEKALSTVKSKDQCYTAEELKLVIRWAHVNWGHSFKPENLCRMTRFDGYLSDALIWADGHGSNPKACPHEEIIKLWNEKFPSKAVSLHEWNRRRPAYRDLEAVWNGKTTQGNWRELKHMGMAFELISKSSLFGTRGDQPWLTLDWILNPKNWGSVYEQAINEHRERKGVKA